MNSIIYENNQISEGKIRGLISNLIINYSKQDEFSQTFLLTSQYFITAIQLLKVLITFFLSPLFNFKNQEKIRENIIDFIHDWIDLYFTVLQDEPGWLSEIKEFINILSSKKKYKNFEIVLSDALIEHDFKKALAYPKIKTEKGQKPKDITIFDIDIVVLAKQLTLKEQQYFREIPLHEFCFTKWNGMWATNKRQAPNLCKFINRFNDMAYWVATTIIKKKVLLNIEQT